MPLPEYNKLWTPAVRKVQADCNDAISTNATWPLPAANATIVELGSGRFPAWSLQGHGWAHWIATGTIQPGTGNTLRVQPRADGGLATGAAVLNFSIGTVTNVSYFILEVIMAVLGSTTGVDRQMWRAQLTIHDGATTPTINTTLVTISALDQLLAHKVGLGASIPAGTSSAVIDSVNCLHMNQRNGT